MSEAYRLYHGDNLEIMRGMAAGTVDLIYMDPPFCTGKDWGAFDDRWQDVGADGLAEVARRYHSPAMAGYLAFMEPRLRECRRVLKPAGSIYLHCDPTASHYLKLLMDAVFGVRRFVNEVVWCYKSGGASHRRFARKHDILLFYAKDHRQFSFNVLKVKSYGERGGGRGGAIKYYQDENGTHSMVNARDWWEVSMLSTNHSERIGYPTQKPVALLNRIVEASSNPGDVVLDPFCGSGTTLVAAARAGRRWIGIDSNRDACKIAAGRLSTMFETVAVTRAGGERNVGPGVILKV